MLLQRSMLKPLILAVALVIAGCKSEPNREKPAEGKTTEQSSKEKKIVYIDATANFGRFTHKDSVDYYVRKVHDIGITDLVVDVKPITGEVLYPSKIAPVMTTWEKDDREKDSSWDMLERFIEKGHELGIQVHVSTNIFSGGHNYFDRGLIYAEPDKKHWQTTSYLPEGLTPISAQKNKFSTMLNPALPEVQDYELSVLKELVSMYPELDGIVLDRVRYDGITADFSDASRKLFEDYIGEQVADFPADIYAYDAQGRRTPGTWYKKWLEWRSGVIHDFMYKAHDALKAINPGLIFGDYTGSWYPTYYEVGVNWASKDYDPSEDYEWATPAYKNTGYAEVLDMFLTGNYFYEVYRKEVEQIDTTKVNRSEAGQSKSKAYWYTVEGSADLVNKVVMDKAPVYAGVYVEQYKDNEEQFVAALKMCRKKSKGVMIFDIVHIIDKNWWKALEKGLNEDLKAE